LIITHFGILTSRGGYITFNMTLVFNTLGFVWKITLYAPCSRLFCFELPTVSRIGDWKLWLSHRNASTA